MKADLILLPALALWLLSRPLAWLVRGLVRARGWYS